MKKQTAVDWLTDQVEDFIGLIPTDIIEKALAMEKEQAFQFWNGGIDCTEEGGKSFEQYYNETYGN
jgi:phosphosulfolactate synthase (CoM biosynthesis protein A)